MLKIKANEDLFNKWNDLAKMTIFADFVKFHITPIMQNDIELEAEELKEFKTYCHKAIDMLEQQKEKIKALYLETIKYIKGT